MSDEGEDSPPPRPRRKIKKIVLASSSSGSETDDSGPATSTRKKRPRVLSDEDSESGGSSVLVGRRRKRALPCLRDSEGDSDTSGWATDHSDAAARSQTAAAGEGASRPLKTASGFASDSSEGNSDKCSICLMRFTDQQVGTPQTCEHIFCLDCITEWSRNVNTCPVDRMTFDSIVVRACAGGRVLRTQSVQVVERPPSVEMLLVEDPTSCEICGGTNSEETMLLCDGCDLGFHMECLTPPLTRIPTNQWLCPGCSERLHVLHAEQVSDVELFSDASETEEAAPGQPRRRAGAGAGAGRAGAGRARRPPPAAASTSRGAASAPAPAQRRAARTRRAHKRRRTRTRTLVIEYELQEDGKTPVTKRVRRKLTRRKTRRRVPRTAARRTQVRRSVRAKLAAQRTERAGAGGGACGAGRRALAGLVPPLSLFGTPGDLDYFSGDDDAQPGPAGAAVAARAALAAPSAAIAAYRQARRKMVSIPSPAHAAAAPDLLSSILESQTLLHSRRSVVSLSGSGELQVRLRPERRPAASPPADRPAAAGRLQVGAGGAGGARQAPSYPGQARGGGGWGGGYHYPAQRAPPAAGGARPPYDNGYGPGPAGGRPRAAGDDVFRPYEERRPHYGPPAPAWRPPRPPRRRTPHDDPLDMRLATGPRCAPLPAPPAFPLPPDDDDAGLVIDTDKYDPTEPTDDDEPPAPPAPAAQAEPAPAPPPLAPPASLAAVESLLAGGAEAGAAHVPAAVLDSAVRQVLLEHRSLLEPAGAERRDSDEGSDGDCPNFSIYSAASVHIAAAALEPPAPAPAPPAPPAPPPALDPLQRKSAEYNEKVSKRCPITTNTRNPIKIKLNTPALIRRQVSLYDEEDAPADGEPPAEPADTAHPDPPEAVVAEPPEAGDPDPPEHAEPPPEPADEKDDTCEPDVEHGSAREPSEHGDGGAEERQPDEDDTGRTPEPPERAAGSPRGSPAAPDAAEKMTESISETEDERSYTPCLDEQREPERADHGLGTELISEDEGDGLFSEAERPSREPSRESEPAREPALAPAPSRSPSRSPSPPADAPRKKKKKEGKTKERKVKGGKLAFKKAGKGKERKYRSRSRSRSRSPSAASGGARSERRAREKRADLERYDVRTLVSERRRRVKDAFGRDVSPRAEPEPAPRRRSASSEPRRARAEPTPPPPRRARARPSPSPRRLRGSPEPRRTRPSPSPSPPMVRRSASPRPARRRRRSSSRGRRADGKRRRSGSRARKRRRSGSAPAVKPKAKKKKRARSERPRSRSRKKSPKRKRARRRSASRAASPPAEAPRPASPRTPPAPPAPVPIEQRRLRKRRDRSKHRRADAAGPCKEVFTSGDNILVSVSFAEAGGADEAERRERRRERRRRRREAQPAPPSKPVAIIDLARSPCRELTPSPERVIVLSDEEAPPAPAPPPAAPVAGAGPMTPPSTTPAPSAPPPPADEGAGGGGRGPLTPPEPPDSPDAYDPFEPTASPPAAAPPHASPPRPSMTLEAAQKTNMSADEVLDRRPLSPIEKVMALLQSTRDAPPDPPPEGGAGAGTAPEPEAVAPRVVLPEPAGAGAARQPAPKLFLAKPSPIKSDPIKPMQQATKISRLPLPAVARGAGAGGGAAGGGDSPYSPGSSDFGDLFEPPAPPHHAPDHFDALFDKPPPRRKRRHNNKKGKTQVDVKIADDSLKVLDELPSSAVEMQVKTKFLKKLNRQERVVEEVKLVLKPHYNKKHVSKDEYKHILRRAVPKICHNKTGEINPTKIQALVEAYVKKFRKKHKLGVS